jgi:hypothetical protein
MADTPPALAAANSRRRQAALSAARHAMAELQASGATITFAAVATTSGVARSWLYEQAEIRQLIGGLRRAGPPPLSRHDERASTESLHRIAEGLRLELARLREENKTLRDQLARQLGINRTQTTTPKPAFGEDMSSPSSPGPTRTS